MTKHCFKFERPHLSIEYATRNMAVTVETPLPETKRAEVVSDSQILGYKVILKM